MTITPAYGKDYNSAREAIAAWKSGSDFVIADIVSPYCGKYVSIRDVPTETVSIRYKRNTCVTVVKPGK